MTLMHNVFSVDGRLGKDAEIKTSSKGTQYISFSLCTDMGMTERNDIWFQCRILRDIAGGIKLLTMGQRVIVNGQLTIGSFADGKPSYAINVHTFHPIFTNKLESEPQSKQPTPTPQRIPPEPTKHKPYSPSTNYDDFDDDIPF